MTQWREVRRGAEVLPALPPSTAWAALASVDAVEVTSAAPADGVRNGSL